jgi:sugar lactone lactonase YvrE
VGWSPMRRRPELVLDGHAWLGEGPLWDAGRAVLWWVDILEGALHAFDPLTGADRSMHVAGTVGCVVPAIDGRMLAATTHEVVVVDPERGSVEPVATFPAAAAALRSNDGRCDPAGRFWIGRMAFDAADGAGALLRLDVDGRLTTVLPGQSIPNGLAWPADGRTLVYIDSADRRLRRFAYDPATGDLGPGRTLLDLADLDLPADALPDGMAIDEEDGLWVAVWGGGCLLRVSLGGELLDRIDLPVSQPSSCTFGGADLGDLYVTTAREGFGPADEVREPTAGGLYRLRPGVRGRPPRAWTGTSARH